MTTNYKGSQATKQKVENQIIQRWGEEEAKNYDPSKNCMTYKQWLDNGYKVKKGEKAIKSFTVVEKKDEDGNPEKSYIKTVNLFYIKQVEKI